MNYCLVVQIDNKKTHCRRYLINKRRANSIHEYSNVEYGESLMFLIVCVLSLRDIDAIALSRFYSSSTTL